MDILGYLVDWQSESPDTHPFLSILVNGLNDILKTLDNNFKYEKYKDIYFAEYYGFVSYFYYEKPDCGYGGEAFNLQMIDGTTEKLIGPFSSRAGFINNLQYFDSIIDVALIDNVTKLCVPGTVTLDFLNGFSPKKPTYFVKTKLYETDIVYIPSVHKHKLIKPIRSDYVNSDNFLMFNKDTKNYEQITGLDFN